MKMDMSKIDLSMVLSKGASFLWESQMEYERIIKLAGEAGDAFADATASYKNTLEHIKSHYMIGKDQSVSKSESMAKNETGELFTAYVKALETRNRLQAHAEAVRERIQTIKFLLKGNDAHMPGSEPDIEEHPWGGEIE